LTRATVSPAVQPKLFLCQMPFLQQLPSGSGNFFEYAGLHYVPEVNLLRAFV